MPRIGVMTIEFREAVLDRMWKFMIPWRGYRGANAHRLDRPLCGGNRRGRLSRLDLRELLSNTRARKGLRLVHPSDTAHRAAWKV
jgi:hypothetical protein